MRAEPRQRSKLIAGGRVLAAADAGAQVRWREGERLERVWSGLLAAAGRAQRIAVDGPEGTLTYGELDAHANRLARFLHAQAGVRDGDRVALALERPTDIYAAMLAVLKLHAAYVPLDAGSPADRVAYIVGDAEVSVVLSVRRLEPLLEAAGADVRRVYLDEHAAEIARQDGTAPELEGGERDGLAYVIYTSGTTGRPKGVPIEHHSICNFVRVAAESYGLRADDRVYQGLTVAFDFAVEEIWVPWVAGATLVPKPAGVKLLGAELHSFLEEHQITALCCVPTLLATLEDDLPRLRFLLLSGESCPQDLVARWHRPGRRLLNVYGPTETTVTATWAVLHPRRPVTVGVPLPSYYIAILDPQQDRVLPPHAEGEIAIGGIGLADGYLNRPEKTAAAFIADPLALPDNPSGRIYRTGDLGAVNDRGELEHRGRIDTQVKIRGYRIELAEIEAVLREAPGVEQAVVSACTGATGVDELVGYYVARDGHADADQIRALARERLPAYMVPAYLEQLDELPLMPSGKVDRRRLPEPRSTRFGAGGGAYTEPSGELEAALAGCLAELLGLEQVSVSADFFDELGASSLLLARFSAELHARGTEPPVSIRDLYANPSVRKLARALTDRVSDDRQAGEVSSDWREPAPTAARGTPHPALCGAFQLTVFLAYLFAGSVLLDAGGRWLLEGAGGLAIYARAVAFGAALLVGPGLVPIAAKWLLVGRFKVGALRIWSVPYMRFWVVKTLIVSNPLARLVVGTPLYNLYLRALGAHIGPGAVLFTRHVPACPDLVTIGAGAVVRREAFLNGYRARSGVIETGPVKIAASAFVGEQTVLDIDTALGRGAQLGHASSLQAGQRVPAGECWHGSPAQRAPAGVDYCPLSGQAAPRGRRALFGMVRTVALFALLGPLEALVMMALLSHPRLLAQLPAPDAVATGALVTVGLTLLALALASLVPRLLTRVLETGRVYPLYGLHYAAARMIRASSNIPSLTALLGDSSAIVHYLRLLGYKLGRVEQTGSNFGMVVRQEVPGLCEVGTGTMVSDGLSMLNVDYAAGAFRVLPVRIGARSFLGNGIAFPPGAAVGENVLFATKAMVPIAGAGHRDTGLLGSPCFEIPRTAGGDAAPEPPPPGRAGTAAGEHEREAPAKRAGGEARQRLLARKLRHNIATMALHELARVALVAGVFVIALAPLAGASGWRGWVSTIASELLDLGFIVALWVTVERLVIAVHPLRPRRCSIYRREFWRHERYWKVPSQSYLRLFNGTPFKPLIWRALGVKVGHGVFDDGAILVERSLVSLGDRCTLNVRSTLQGHSLENGMFKSDRIVIGPDCTLGVGAFVHYGTELGARTELATDAFVMKGSRSAAGSRWRGNPAVEVAPAPAYKPTPGPTPAPARGPAAASRPATARTERGEQREHLR